MTYTTQLINFEHNGRSVVVDVPDDLHGILTVEYNGKQIESWNCHDAEYWRGAEHLTGVSFVSYVNKRIKNEITETIVSLIEDEIIDIEGNLLED